MYFIELNDASRFKITDIIKETSTELKGVRLKALEFEICEATIETIRAKFMNEFNTRTVKLLSEQKTLMTVYNGYNILRSIATNEVEINDNPEAVPNFVIVLAQTDDAQKLIPQLNERIGELEETIIQLTVTKTPEEMELNELKTYLVTTSKLNLENYLANNPIRATVHGEEEGLYSCSLEKQTLLNNAIAMAQIHEAMGDTEYKISWNQAGEDCTYDWTKEELIALAIQIEAFVKPLISKQQKMEKDIMAATTNEEALAISLTF